MQQPMQQPQNQAVAWLRRLTRAQQVGIGCLGLIVVCALCGGIGNLLGAGAGANGANSGTTSTNNATQAPQATSTPTATPKPKTWHTVKHYSGNNNQQTETFHVSSDQWRIVWKDTVTGDFGGDFSIELYTSDNSLVDLVANTSGNGNQTYNAHAGPGDYYMKISGLDVNYTVTVEEYS